jgi:hypothetical protein
MERSQAEIPLKRAKCHCLLPYPHVPISNCTTLLCVVMIRLQIELESISCGISHPFRDSHELVLVRNSTAEKCGERGLRVFYYSRKRGLLKGVGRKGRIVQQSARANGDWMRWTHGSGEGGGDEKGRRRGARCSLQSVPISIERQRHELT